MRLVLTLIAALACGSAFAQSGGGAPGPTAPGGPTTGSSARPAADMNKAANAGEMNKNARVAATAAATSGNAVMDTNGDGFISRKEWNAYHGARWSQFKPDRRGMVPWADVQARLKEGPP